MEAQPSVTRSAGIIFAARPRYLGAGGLCLTIPRAREREGTMLLERRPVQISTPQPSSAAGECC